MKLFPIILSGDPHHVTMQAETVSRLTRKPVKPCPVSEAPVKVIYRTFRDVGETIALFPEIAYDPHGDFCMSYMHVGQHGAASPMECSFARITRPATAEEIEPLARELEAIGYSLAPVRRASFKMHKARRQALTV